MECPICHGDGVKNGYLCQSCNGTGNIINNPLIAGRLILMLLFILFCITMCTMPPLPPM